MNRFRLATLLIGAGIAVIFAGCAKEDVVRKDEPVAQQTVKSIPAVPKPVAQAPKTQTIPAASSAVVTSQENRLETIYFDFDKSELRQDARDLISKNAALLLKNMPGVKVRVEGHCDERGSDEYNLALGDRRARSVMQYLVTLGVTSDRLSTISYGKEKPAVQGSDEAAWAKNRRAEFIILQKQR